MGGSAGSSLGVLQLANNSGLCSATTPAGNIGSGNGASPQGCSDPVDTSSLGINTTTETNPNGDYYTTTTDSAGNVVGTLQGHRDPNGGPNEWYVMKDAGGKITYSHETTGSDDGNNTTTVDREFGPDGNITGSSYSTFDRDPNGNTRTSLKIFDGTGTATYQNDSYFDASNGKITSTSVDANGKVTQDNSQIGGTG